MRIFLFTYRINNNGSTNKSLNIVRKVTRRLSSKSFFIYATNNNICEVFEKNFKFDNRCHNLLR